MRETYDLQAYLTATDFKVRIAAKVSESNEEMAVDNVRITGASATPPAPLPAQNLTNVEIIYGDTFSSGLFKWDETGEGDWRHGKFDEFKTIPGYTDGNIVAEVDDCDTSCTLTMRTPIDLTWYASATLEFDRFVDNAADPGEYLSIEAGRGNAWMTAFNFSAPGVVGA